MMDLRPLLASFALAGLAVSMWGHLHAPILETARWRHLALGTVLGCGAAVSMLAGSATTGGLMIDVRGPLIGLSGLFGGPSAALVAMVLASICRLDMGGPTALSGCLSIVIFAVLGSVAWWLARARTRSLVVLGLFSVAIAAVPMLMLPLQPAAVRAASVLALLPLAAMSGCSTFFFGLALRRDERFRALLRQDAFYRAIIEALPDSLCAKDTESRFLAANTATAGMMGTAAPAALIGKTDADFYPPDIAARFRREELDVLADKPLGPFDQEIAFKDGRRRWFTTMKIPLRDTRGSVIGLVIHNRDITDRKALEASLLRTQNYLREAMDNMADGLVLYDRTGRIRFCNSRYTTMFPLTTDLRVTGGRFEDIMRASIERGEVVSDLPPEAYVSERTQIVWNSGETMIELRDGRTIELRMKALPDADALVLCIDVTARKQFERDLLRRASHDPLTGLANRSAFEARLDEAFRKAIGQRRAFAVMMLDLDRFKQVNDTFGHAVGDLLLVDVAQRLREEACGDTFVGRLGGDEFVVLIEGDDIETATVQLANRVVKRLRQSVRIEGVDLTPGGSVGLAYFPLHAGTTFDLLRSADKALYAVKTRGGGTWGVAAPFADERAADELDPAAIKSVA